MRRADHSSRGVLSRVVCVCDLKTSTMRRSRPQSGSWDTIQNKINVKDIEVSLGQHNKRCGNKLRLRQIQLKCLVSSKHEVSKTTPESLTVIYPLSPVNFSTSPPIT